MSMSNDGFDTFREDMGAECVNTFLAKFGLGPDYKPEPILTHICPTCLCDQAYYKEEGADCDGGQNEMVLYCPDCGFTEYR